MLAIDLDRFLPITDNTNNIGTVVPVYNLNYYKVFVVFSNWNVVCSVNSNSTCQIIVVVIEYNSTKICDQPIVVQ